MSAEEVDLAQRRIYRAYRDGVLSLDEMWIMTRIVEAAMERFRP